MDHNRAAVANDIFEIYSRLSANSTLKSNSSPSSSRPSNNPGVINTDFLESLQNLFNAGRQTADVTLIVDGQRLQAHSLVLSLRSRFFAGACAGGFKEAETREIHLPDDDFFAIHRLLLHCYNHNYPGTPLSNTGKEEAGFVSTLYTHATMYSLADKYAMHDLKTEALQKFRHAMEEKIVPSVQDLKHLLLEKDAYTMQIHKVHDYQCSRVYEVMPLVYTSTPENDRGLRDIVASFAAADWGWFKVRENIRDVEYSQFVFDVAGELGKKVETDKAVGAWRAYSTR